MSALEVESSALVTVYAIYLVGFYFRESGAIHKFNNTRK